MFLPRMFSSCETFFTSPSRAEQLELMAYSTSSRGSCTTTFKQEGTNNQAASQERLITNRYCIHKLLRKYKTWESYGTELEM